MAVEFYKEFGELGYLANYSDHGFYDTKGIYYPTVEHYYQSHKFNNPTIIDSILKASTPKEASIIGRDCNNTRIPHFDKKKLEVMHEGVYLKFSQNKDIRSKLIETHNQEIREMSVKESFWGVGPELDGENHIGKILMNVRDEVKKDLLDSILCQCKDKTIYVIGHAKSDVDSFYSAMILTRILKSMGIDARLAVRDEEFIDVDLLQDFGMDDYEVITDFSDKQFILVDQNQLNGIPKENVIGAIDHHRITGEIDDLIEIEYSSTGLLIYDLFKDRYSFTEEDKEKIALTVLSDTEFLTSSRFTPEDQELYKELSCQLDPQELKRKYFKTTIFNLDINENLLKDSKDYQVGKYVIKRSLIKSFHQDYLDHYHEYVDSMKKNHIGLLIWCDYEDLETYICYQGISLKFPYFTNSTYLVLDYLEKEKYLRK